MVAKGEGVVGEEVGVGVSRCKLLCIYIEREREREREWINGKVPLYSTENYIHYPMINHNGKEYKKRIYICIYIFMYN